MTSVLSSDLSGLPTVPAVPPALLQPCRPVAHTAGEFTLGAGSHFCQNPEPRTYPAKNVIDPERTVRIQIFPVSTALLWGQVALHNSMKFIPEAHCACLGPPCLT